MVVKTGGKYFSVLSSVIGHHAKCRRDSQIYKWQIEMRETVSVKAVDALSVHARGIKTLTSQWRSG